jgi:hypothetical protein
MATGPFLLRIEGVNLNSFVYDTQNLSTIRGGSLLLLDEVEGIGTTYPELTPISTGASAGLFRVQDGVDAQQIAAKLRNDLLTHHQLQHATFVVDVAQMLDDTPKSFVAARERLIALNRFQQQHAPMVSIPEWNMDDSAAVCEVDHVKAAIASPNSPAVNVRQQYGVAAKQSFYKRQFPQDEQPNPAADMTFTNDLEHLAHGYENETLNDKIAVIYIDGNSFSTIQNNLLLAAANAENKQEQIDKQLKDYRREFLRSLLAEMKSHPELWRNKENSYRLEVLLWGGDDMLLVVPSWVGWRTASLFYKTAKDWELVEPLKHAMGLVFCHHNAPIHRITQLARELAERAKGDQAQNMSYRAENLIAYAVLETFDHAGSDLDAYRSKRFPTADTKKILLNGEMLDDAISAFAAVASDIPRGKVYLLVRLLLEQLHHPNPDDKKRESISEQINKIDAEIQTSCRNKSKLQELVACLGGTPGAWAHILELWDYLRN